MSRSRSRSTRRRVSPTSAAITTAIRDYLRMTGAAPAHGWVSEGWAMRQHPDRVVVSGNIGFAGYYAGPQVHIIDCHGLGDPLLAQLPAHRHWRIGHFARQMPAGYLATRATGRNAIADAELATFYRYLQDIASGDLWDRHATEAHRRDESGRVSPSARGLCDRAVGVRRHHRDPPAVLVGATLTRRETCTRRARTARRPTRARGSWRSSNSASVLPSARPPHDSRRRPR